MNWPNVFVEGLKWHAIALAATLALALVLQDLKFEKLAYYLRHIFGVLVLLILAHMFVVSQLAELIGRKQGFHSGGDWLQAGQEDIFDPVTWEARLVVKKEEEREQKQAQLSAQMMSATTAQMNRVAEAERCKVDARCFSRDFLTEAQTACTELVESQAVYGLKWETGLFEDHFSEVGWVNKSSGTISLTGQKARLQNQYGVWGKASYMCSYDVTAKDALSASITIKD